METALKQHSVETSGAQTAAPKCHEPDRSIIALDPPGAWQDFSQYTNTSLRSAYTWLSA